MAPPPRPAFFDDPDEALIKRAQAGGRDAPVAFGLLVQRHQDRIVRFVAYLLASPSDADDVAQEAFSRAFLALPRSGPVLDFGAWMRRVALRVAFNHRRSRTRRGAFMQRLRDSSPPERADSDAVEHRDLIDKVLAKLEYPEREVLVLRHVEELSIEEIAHMLDLGVSATKMRLKRARERFWRTHQELLVNGT